MNGHQGDSRDLDDNSPSGAETPRGVQPAPFARLKERSEFLAVAKGARMHEPAFTLQAIARDPGPQKANVSEPALRFGLTVTKKTGNSVVRNRIRRRLREALRVSGVARDEVADGAARDYVIVARREVLSRDFVGLAGDLVQAVKRIDRRLRGKPGSKSGAKPGASPQRAPSGKPAD